MSKRTTILLVGLAALLPAGCPQQSATDAQFEAPPASVDQALADGGDQSEQQRRAAAWLMSDTDHDGLTNGLEEEYGLDPEDPTDGLDIDGDGILNCCDEDIDGDGVLNESDPDIDGDGILNLIDRDTDGDAIPDRIDLDIDADGVRNRWDSDDDGDGEEDVEEDEDDDEKDDEDEDDEDKDKEDGEQTGDANQSGQEDDVILKEFLRLARATALFDDTDDSGADTGGDDSPDADNDATTVDERPSDPEVSRFAAHVEQLSQLSEKGDANARKQLRRLLLGIDAGLLLPIDPDSEEARKTAQQFARRLGFDDVSTEDVLGYIDRLQKISRPPADDATDAFDVLDDNISDVTSEDPSDAGDALEDRLENIERLAQDFSDLRAPDLSQAIRDLTHVLRDIALDDKVDGLLDLGESIDDPDLRNVVDGFTWLATNLEGIETGDDLDEVIDTLKSVPGIEDGIDQDELEAVEEQWQP